MREQVEWFFSTVRSAWRFRWSALLIAAVVGTLETLAILAYPGTYESHAQIHVDTKSVLRPLLQGLAVTDQNDRNVDVVRQALLARPTLDKVASDIGLYERVHTAEGVDKMLAGLAAKISIQGDAGSGLYTITYADSSPRMAQSVVQKLLDAFFANAIGAGRTDNRNAVAFLAQQVADYEKRLSDSEQRIAEFKKKNLGLMPDERGDYFARLQAELSSRDKLKTDLAVAVEQRDELKSKISVDFPRTSKLGAALTNQQIQAAEALDARIREANTTLGALLDQYTELHPRVIAQKELIRRLEEQRQGDFGDVRSTNATQTRGSSVATDPVVQNLQIALNDADLRVTTLQTQLKQSQEQVAVLQQTVTTGPQIEAQLVSLNRDYGVTKAEYDALLQRLESARISNDADRSAEQRFKVLEPPRVPLLPSKPNKPELLTLALLLAFGAGAGFALARAQMYPVFFAKSAVVAALNLPVIGIVSAAYSRPEISKRRFGILLYSSLLAAYVLVVGTVAVLNFPASQVLRRLMGVASG